MKNNYLKAFLIFLCYFQCVSQNVSLFNQFNGKYDYTFIGNTMNTAENNLSINYVTETTSSANLNLNSGLTIKKAYLYWAGSGNGDFNVNLNGVALQADRTFGFTRNISGIDFTYFAAFKEVTDIVASNGNGTYTLSNLDISAFEALHFSRKTNFAGWAILIVYENNSLPINQLNIYDGLQGVPNNLEISLNNLNVIDNTNASAGFIAWEGDADLATENFKVNNNVLSNAQNPANNVFNGSNSITGTNNLYNMDLDIYNIQNYINNGDTNATITLSSSQDFIMIGTVVTKLNSQLPDATIAINNVQQNCNSKTLYVNYSVSNNNATAAIPAQTPVAVYINNTLITSFLLPTIINIDTSYSSTFSIEIPSNIDTTFELKLVVDDNGINHNTIVEIIENNNTSISNIPIWNAPKDITLPFLETCNLGNTKGTFDLTSHLNTLQQLEPNTIISFYENENDAITETNPILILNNYTATTTPSKIYYKIKNENCFVLNTFDLYTKNCMPTVYNYVSSDNNSLNDTFFIDGLRDIFLNFELEIYNRWGKLVWTGTNNTKNWDGYSNQNVISPKEKCPTGVYYYVLNLNDSNYPKPLVGYLYLVVR